MHVLRTLLVTMMVLLVLLVGSAAALLLLLDDDDYRRITAYVVERLTGRTLTVDGSFSFDLSLEPSLTVSGVRVENPPWATHPDLARVGRLEVQLALRPLLSGTLLIPHLVLEDAHFDLEKGADGKRNWTTSAEGVDAGADGFLIPVLGSVMLRNVAWRYRDATGRDSSIELDHLTIEEVGGVGRLDGAGLWDGRRIAAKGEFGTLSEALHPTQPFPLDLVLSLPGLDLALHGTVVEPTTGRGIDLHLTGHSNDVSRLLDALGSDLSVAGRLAGDAKLGGDLTALQLDKLSLSLIEHEKTEPSVDVTGQIETVHPDRAALFEGVDLNVRIATSTATLSSWLGREMPDLGSVDGQLAVTGNAESLAISDVRLQIGEAGRLTIAAAGEVAAIQLWPELMVRGVDVHFQANAPTTAALAEALDRSLPELGAVAASARLSGGADQLDLEHIVLRAGTGDRSIQVSGQIDNLLLHGKAPASATFESAMAPLLGGLLDKQLPELGRVRASAQWADVDGDLRVEQLEIVADDTDVLTVKAAGVPGQAANGDGLELDIDLSSKDLAIVGTLLDLSIPPLGPFSYSGRLGGDLEAPRLSGKARLGQTEIDGAITATLSGARPSVSGKLSIPVLYLADVGIRPDRPWGAAASSVAEAAGGDSGGPGTTTLPFAALQGLDLSLLVQIDQIEGVNLSIDRGTIAATLKDGVLRIDPARFDYVGGSFAVDGTVDSRPDPPRIALDVVADDVELGKVFAQVDKVVPLDGELDMRLSLKSAGSSLQNLTSSLEGELAMAVARGEISIAYFDLAGANLLHWLFRDSKTKGGTDLRCFVAQMDIDAGVANSKTLLLETSLTISKGSGYVDLVKQTIDILVRPHSRGVRFDITTPYRIHGSLSDPSVEYSKGRLLARVVEELVLSPINTLQALIPLLADGGKDQDNPCLDWSPTPATTTTEPGTSGPPVEDMTPAPYVATTASHVREGPGTTHPLIETLATGATVQVTGKAVGLDWYRVSLADDGVGYVWAKLLEPAGPSPTR